MCKLHINFLNAVILGLNIVYSTQICVFFQVPYVVLSDSIGSLSMVIALVLVILQGLLLIICLLLIFSIDLYIVVIVKQNIFVCFAALLLRGYQVIFGNSKLFFSYCTTQPCLSYASVYCDNCENFYVSLLYSMSICFSISLYVFFIQALTISNSVVLLKIFFSGNPEESQRLGENNRENKKEKVEFSKHNIILRTSRADAEDYEVYDMDDQSA